MNIGYIRNLRLALKSAFKKTHGLSAGNVGISAAMFFQDFLIDFCPCVVLGGELL